MVDTQKSNEDKDFERFWELYPRKVGKLAARLAWARARKQTSAEEIIDGIACYKQSKPDYADWCHPRTYLSQGRWMDEPDVDVAVKPIDRRPAWLRQVIK